MKTSGNINIRFSNVFSGIKREYWEECGRWIYQMVNFRKLITIFFPMSYSQSVFEYFVQITEIEIYLKIVLLLETFPASINLFRVSNKNTRVTSVASFWCFYCELWTYFTPLFSSDSIVDFEQVNVGWFVTHFKLMFQWWRNWSTAL